MSLIPEIDPHLMFNARPMFRNEVGLVSKDKMYPESGQAAQTITVARVSWQQSQHKKREVPKGLLPFNRTAVDQVAPVFNDLTIAEARTTNQVVIKGEDNSLPFLLCETNHIVTLASPITIICSQSLSSSLRPERDH